MSRRLLMSPGDNRHLISRETLLSSRPGEPQIRQVWTAPGEHLPALAGPDMCQAGPEKRKAPLPPPPQSGHAEVSDWVSVSRQTWTRKQAVHILQPGVEWYHRPKSHLAQARGPAAQSAPPVPPTHPKGMIGAVMPDLAALGNGGMRERKVGFPAHIPLSMSGTNPRQEWEQRKP